MRNLIIATALLLAVPVLDSQGAWGPSGCAAVAVKDGWYKADHLGHPAWECKYQSGRVVEWFKPSTGEYLVLRGQLWQKATPPAEWMPKGAGAELPASDLWKWHVTVVVERDAPMTGRILADWATSPDLAVVALADPKRHKESWGFIHWIYTDDASQNWRFFEVEDGKPNYSKPTIQFTGFPTVLIQPPRDRSLGDPATVVFQGVYAGDARAMAVAMCEQIGRYARKVAPKQSVLVASLGPVVAQIEQPFKPAPKTPPAPGPSPSAVPTPGYVPVIPPTPPPTPAPAPAHDDKSLAEKLKEEVDRLKAEEAERVAAEKDRAQKDALRRAALLKLSDVAAHLAGKPKDEPSPAPAAEPTVETKSFVSGGVLGTILGALGAIGTLYGWVKRRKATGELPSAEEAKAVVTKLEPMIEGVVKKLLAKKDEK